MLYCLLLLTLPEIAFSQVSIYSKGFCTSMPICLAISSGVCASSGKKGNEINIYSAVYQVTEYWYIVYVQTLCNIKWKTSVYDPPIFYRLPTDIH